MTSATQYLESLPPARRRKALELIDYMLGPAIKSNDANDVLRDLSERICAGGVPVTRTASIVRLLHTEAAASARFWDIKAGTRNDVYMVNPSADAPDYAKSPARIVRESGEWLEIWVPDTPDDRYELIPGLKRDEITHYLMAPVFMRTDLEAIFSFATTNPDGFSQEDLHFLRGVFPALAAAQEVLVTHHALTEVTRIYVGNEPQKRILSGDVTRGEVTRVRSVILFADMRRFTELTSRMQAEEATELLNRYYDCIVPHIIAAKGEVLKFIGDGILAQFPTTGDDRAVCRAAYSVAKAGLRDVAADSGKPQFEVGIALHFGEVAFGNVGSGNRLDYTVIGRDVNLAARVAGLCGNLSAPLLVSGDFADILNDSDLAEQGAHTLKGLEAPVRVFAPLPTNPVV